MVLSISGLLLLGIIIFLFFRNHGLKVSHFVISALFGFYLAGTSIAPSIRSGGQGLANLLGNIQ